MDRNKTVVQRFRALIKRNKKGIFRLLVYVVYICFIVAAFLLVGAYHSGLASIMGLNDQVQLDLQSIANVVGIASAALALVISNRLASENELESSRNQIYQQLEFQSIQQFRFEIDHVDLARIIWEDSESYAELKKDDDRSYQVLQLICQVLNLFEMAFRFKADGIIHDDVFNSWVAWIYDLCSSEIFLHYWYLEGIRDNYIVLFQESIDLGLEKAHTKEKVDEIKKKVKDPGYEKGLAEFHKFMQNIFIEQR
ncbi:MAG: hypothetical protein OEL83_09080 [Desulforhopalus sp.]|nr:hypothetical protein [Desulforhopalus sp.]